VVEAEAVFERRDWEVFRCGHKADGFVKGCGADRINDTAQIALIRSGDELSRYVAVGWDWDGFEVARPLMVSLHGTSGSVEGVMVGGRVGFGFGPLEGGLGRVVVVGRFPFGMEVDMGVTAREERGRMSLSLDVIVGMTVIAVDATVFFGWELFEVAVLVDEFVHAGISLVVGTPRLPSALDAHPAAVPNRRPVAAHSMRNWGPVKVGSPDVRRWCG
jgi:hypothetical protein